MSAIQNRFAQNLKSIRKERNLRQQDVAEKAGMLATTFNRIENQKMCPSIDTVGRIAEAMEIPYDVLFQSGEIKDRSLAQKVVLLESLSEYNRNVIEIFLETVIEKDRLEKLQEVKMKKRLKALERIRK